MEGNCFWCRKWKGVSQRLSLGLFIFRFLSIFNPCFVCLYDVYTSVWQCVLLWFFLSLPDIPAINIPVLARYSPPTLIDAPTHTLTHTQSLTLTLSSPYMSLILYGSSHVLHTLSTPSLSISLGRKVLFVLCLDLLINRALTAEPRRRYVHKHTHTTDRTGTEECTWLHGPGRHSESTAAHGGNELDGDCGGEGVSVIDGIGMMMRRERENTATVFLCFGLPISVSFILGAERGLP